MKHIKILIVALLCMVAGTANAETKTRTYLFSGSQSANKFSGYFYEEGKDAHYSCFPSQWTYGSDASIHATLADGITITIASSTNHIGVLQGNLVVEGNVTVTVDGGDRYYIHRVKLLHVNGQTLIDDYNLGADAASTHTFSKTINQCSFRKLEITYSDKDIYCIDESTTTISGVEEQYDYTDSPITPEPVIVCNGRTLNIGDYGLGYTNNKTHGTATLTVIGNSPYHGSVSKNFTIFDRYPVPSEWVAGQTIEVITKHTLTDNVSVTGSGNVSLVIADGVTLTLNSGITIADGATLTVKGPGSLKVNGMEGNEGAPGVNTDHIIGGQGGQGGTGDAGISGSVIVNGGTVTVKGGQGGQGGEGGSNGTGGNSLHTGGEGGEGGEGGVGISGSLTVNGGTVTVTGGTGGDGGDGGRGLHIGDDGKGGSGGIGIDGSLTVNGGTATVDVSGGFPGTGDNASPGKAIDGTVTCTTNGYVIQESSNKSTWSNLSSGNTSSKRYVRVFETRPLTLYDHATNASAIAEAAGNGQWYSVTLDGRTLFKDGNWNTLCLPFDVKLAVSQLAGAEARTLDDASLSGGTLTLDFGDPVDELKAGTPYIIKWDGDGSNNLVNPVFTGVTIDNTMHDATFGYVSFKGTYNSGVLSGKSVLYLGSGNQLYYPSENTNKPIGAFRAYFQLTDPSLVKQFVLNFGEDDATGIGEFSENSEDSELSEFSDKWFDLDGRKLNGKPSQKGIYIHNGKKEVLK